MRYVLHNDRWFGRICHARRTRVLPCNYAKKFQSAMLRQVSTWLSSSAETLNKGAKPLMRHTNVGFDVCSQYPNMRQYRPHYNGNLTALDRYGPSQNIQDDASHNCCKIALCHTVVVAVTYPDCGESHRTHAERPI